MRGCHLITTWLDDSDLDVPVGCGCSKGSLCQRVHEAAVLKRAVSLRLGGLAQPDLSPLT